MRHIIRTYRQECHHEAIGGKDMKNVSKAMKDTQVAMCPYGGSVKGEDLDKQVILASADLIAHAIYHGMLDSARIIAEAMIRKPE